MNWWKLSQQDEDPFFHPKLDPVPTWVTPEMREENQQARLSMRQQMKEISLKAAIEAGATITPDDHVILYHGTRSAPAIREAGYFKTASYFAVNPKIAMRFANNAQSRGKAIVMKVKADPSKLIPSGGKDLYFSSNEPIRVIEVP